MPVSLDPQQAATALKDSVCSDAEKQSAQPAGSFKDLSLRAITVTACSALKLTTPDRSRTGEQISMLASTASASGPASAAVPVVAGVATQLAPRAATFAQRFSGSVEKILARGEELILFRGTPANPNLKSIGCWWSSDPAIALKKAGADGSLFIARVNQNVLNSTRATLDKGKEGVFQNYLVGPAGFPNATKLAQSHFDAIREGATGIGKLNQQMVRSILGLFD